jgi:hypothetical protein
MANVPISYAIMITVAVMPTVRNVYFILQILLLVRIALYLVMMINIYLCMFFASFFRSKAFGW